MTITEQNQKYWYEDVVPNAPKPMVAKIDENLDAIVAMKVDENALRPGTVAPDFNLPDLEGNPQQLSSLLKNGPVVLAFYRGGWCPFCNIQLKNYQAQVKEFENRGAQLVAVSCETTENANNTKDKHSLTFPVLYDQGAKIAQEYGVAFRIPKATEELHEMVNIPLDKWNGDDGHTLPMPGAFVIGQDGKIAYTFAKSHYRFRAEVEDLVKAIDSL